MKPDPITEFARELAQVGFRQDHLEMQLPRDVNRCGEVSWLSIHRVGRGYRVSVRGNKQARVGISMMELTFENVRTILPEWLRKRIDEEDSPTHSGAGE